MAGDREARRKVKERKKGKQTSWSVARIVTLVNWNNKATPLGEAYLVFLL